MKKDASNVVKKVPGVDDDDVLKELEGAIEELDEDGDEVEMLSGQIEGHGDSDCEVYDGDVNGLPDDAEDDVIGEALGDLAKLIEDTTDDLQADFDDDLQETAELLLS